jgi:hypothetical protein
MEYFAFHVMQKHVAATRPGNCSNPRARVEGFKADNAFGLSMIITH